MKKTLVLLAGLVSLSLAGSAQTLSINNNTSCSFTMYIYGETTNTCGGLSSPIGAPGHWSVSPFTTYVISSTDYEAYDPVTAPIFYPDNVHFNDAAGPTLEIGRPCTTLTNSIVIDIAGCGSHTATWTDLPGGSAQVDVN